MALGQTKTTLLACATNFSTFLFFLAIMGTRPMIPLLAVEMGMSGLEIGLLVGLYSFLPLFAATVVGTWMDRHGAKRVIIAGGIAAAFGLICPILLVGRSGLYTSQIATGCGFTMFTIAAQKFASNFGIAKDDRHRNIARFSLFVALGSFVGPVLVGLLAERFGFVNALALSTVSVVTCVALLSTLTDTPRENNGENANYLPNPLASLSYHRFMLRAFLISTFVLLARDTFVAYFPLYVQNRGVSTLWIGIIIGLHNGGSVLARAFLMVFVNWLGSNKTVILSTIFAGLSFIFIPLCDGVPAYITVAVLLGVALGVGSPLSISTTVNLAPANKIGEVLGARLTCNRLTQIVVPIAFGGMVAQIGLSGAFLLVGAIMAMGSVKLNIPDGATAGDSGN